MEINQANARKEINKIAKAAGLIFKRQHATINGAQAYQFLNRLTGEKVVENMTFWSAYENCMSGYISEKLVK